MVDFLDTFKLSPLIYSHQQEIEKNIDEIPQGNSQDDNFLYLETVQISKYTIGSVIIMAEDYH